MAYLITASHRLHYKTVGSKAKQPLLILHGFLGSCEDFSGVLPLLSERFYCMLPDLPGHGKTITSEHGYSFLETARSLISLLDYLQIDKTNLLGYSMGGRIALYLAVRNPERFSRTILESASPGLRTREERQERMRKDEAIAHQLETMPLQDFLTRWYKNPLFDTLHRHPKAIAAMLKRRQQNQPIELAKALRGLGTGQQKSLWENLHTLSFPLLLMFGSEDEKFAKICKQMMVACKRNKDSRAILNEFEGCGHNVHFEIAQSIPELYIKAIMNFVNKF